MYIYICVYIYIYTHKREAIYICLPPASHPSPLGLHGMPGWLPVFSNSFPPASYFTHDIVYMSILVS